MSEALEDLAREVYGEEGAGKFFQFSQRTWPELATALEVCVPCKLPQEFADYAKYQRTLQGFLETALNATAEARRGLQEKIEGIAQYLDALNAFLTRSLEQYDITTETMH